MFDDPSRRAWALRGAALAAFALFAVLAWQLDPVLGSRGRGGLGALAFVALAFAASRNPAAIDLRTVAWGVVFQVGLALVVIRSAPGRMLFERGGEAVAAFLGFSQRGAAFVFGVLADPAAMSAAFPDRGFVFAFVALPTIIFVSSFFSVLYYLGILQLVVRFFSWVMRLVMRTSGPETLSVVANVFMGQTEAPLVVKPYVAGMTRSELLALMVGGMATVSGSMLAVYMGLGADPVALLATSVMAAPAALYLSKIVLPETDTPATTAPTAADDRKPSSVLEAAAIGVTDGVQLAINVGAMLIAFIAFIALANAGLALIDPSFSLEAVFAVIFAPIAYLIGVDPQDIGDVGNLLGKKLVLNELVAFVDLQRLVQDGTLSPRSVTLATYALTGFANISSIGIQIGGIGAIAPGRRKDLAALGPWALFTGFLATLVNASLAGMMFP